MGPPISKSDETPKVCEAAFLLDLCQTLSLFNLILALISATGILQDSNLVIYEIKEYLMSHIIVLFIFIEPSFFPT